MRDVPLGTLIFRAGLLAEEQLEDALQEGMRTGKRLGEVLAERGLIEDTDLGRLLAGQQGLPYVEAATLTVDPAARERLPENIARMQNALSFSTEDGVPVVAVADPTNELVVENVRRALGVEPRLVVAAHGELARKIQEAYSQASEPAAEPAPAAQVAPVAVAEAPVAVEPPAPAAVVEPEAAPAPVVAPMPTSVPPAEERAPEPEVSTQPLVAAPLAANEVPPLHAQASAEPPLAPEPVVPAPVAAPAPEPAPAPEAAPAAAPVEPVAPAPAAPPPVEPAEPVVIVAETPEAPAPPAAPQQPAEPGLFAQAAEQALAAPVAAPAPPAPQEAAPAPAPVEPTHLVVLRLTGEDRVEIGAFGGQDEAESFARTVVGRISRAEEQAEWPLFGDRFIRPQSIVSVDVVERAGSSWMGSPTRAQWGTPEA